MTQIINPWIIVHQPEGEHTDLITILAGNRDVGYEGFALVIADVVRHVANAFDVDKHDVMRWVEKELRRPTTKLSGVRPS